jgi:hypothetical protein
LDAGGSEGSTSPDSVAAETTPDQPMDSSKDLASEVWGLESIARYDALDPNTEIRTPNGVTSRRCQSYVAEGEVFLADGRIQGVNGAIRDGSSNCNHSVSKVSPMVAGVSAPVPTTNGWVVASTWDTPPFKPRRIVSRFVVPSDPTTASNQLLYFFSSIQGGGWIVQPVLQYGNNGAFGGKYWVISSWAVGPDGKGGNSKPVRVYPGDVLYGDTSGTTCYSNGSCHWKIVTKNSTRGTSTTFTTGNLVPMGTVQASAMEAYGLTSCKQYPASKSITFSGVSVFDQNNQWQRVPWGTVGWAAEPNCKARGSATNLTQPGTATINWN